MSAVSFCVEQHLAFSTLLAAAFAYSSSSGVESCLLRYSVRFARKALLSLMFSMCSRAVVGTVVRISIVDTP